MNQPFTSFKEFKQRYPIRPNDESSLLGIGSYGRVMKVEDQLETEWVAIKISEFKGNDTKSLKAEVELAQRVPRQANIARYDACYRFETDTSVSDFAIMKYYPDGNLADLLRRVILTPTQIYDITQGILLGLQHLHRNRIVHRDFKPANILISRDNAGRLIPKIADFGLSKLVSDDELDSSDFDLSDGRGTPSYKAPEQIEGSRVSFNLDLWAFGVILYEIMTGEKPFRANPQNSSEQSVRREIEKKIISVDLPARLDQVNEPYRTMIRRCLIRDIHERVRKENELLDLLDCIPQLLIDARKSVNNQHYKEAIALFEQVLAKREQHAEALQGVDFCIQALKEQHLANLLQEADDLVEKKRFEQAKERYEQVLKINPAHEKALQKLAFCINGLQPGSLVNEPEITDVYQTEQTDVYAAPSAPIAAKSTPVPTPPVLTKPASSLINKSAASPKPLIAPVIKPNIGRRFPWKTVGPAVLVLGGLIWRFYPTPVEKPPQITTADPVQTANIVPTKDNANDLSPKIPEAAKLKVVPGESKEALNKRIDVALGKARQAYRLKNYAFTVDMANSALLLDPTRRDLVALRTAAMKEMQTRGQDAAKTEVPAVPTPEAQKSTSPEAEKPRATEPAVPESSKTAKQEAQETYEQLIEEGIKAIANGNNKAKAIGTFTKAQGLAKDQDLSTTKADAAYAVYMTKANKIFATDEFDGAKEWYQVARSLKDTEEVRRKIKQCTNQ